MATVVPGGITTLVSAWAASSLQPKLIGAGIAQSAHGSPGSLGPVHQGGQQRHLV